MATRRARSAERPTLPTDMDRIAELLQGLMARPAPAAPAPQPQIIQVPQAPREQFKAPEYNGTGDIEYFIRQFEDVAQANEWNPAATLLHLRSKLKDTAQDCGQAQTVDAVYTALRSRFGISVREARSQLNNLRKQSKTTLHEHAMEVERLVSLAYADLPREHRVEMTVDKFTSSLGNAYLQRHLLAIPAPDLESVVRAGNDYLQIRNPMSNPSLRAVIAEEEELESQQVKPVQANPMQEPVQLLTQLVGDLTRELAELKKKVSHAPVAPTTQMVPSPLVPVHQAQQSVGQKSPNPCWICNGTGHWKRDCPFRSRNAPGQSNQRSGNGFSPQQ